MQGRIIFLIVVGVGCLGSATSGASAQTAAGRNPGVFYVVCRAESGGGAAKGFVIDERAKTVDGRKATVFSAERIEWDNIWVIDRVSGALQRLGDPLFRASCERRTTPKI